MGFFRDHTLIFTRETEEQESRLPPLNNTETEILLHGAVQKFSHDEMLFCNSKRDGNLSDFTWRDLA